MFPLPPSILVELGAFFASVIFWKNIKNSRLRWLLHFLLFIVLVELTGRFIYKEIHLKNAWLYNISVPIEYMFYTFLFSKFYHRKIDIQITKGFLSVFPVWCMFNIALVQGFYNFNTNFLKVGSFFMIIFSFLVFVNLLTTDKLINPFTQPIFWIACGVFLFNAGEFTYDTLIDLMVKEWRINEKLFIQINNNLIYVLYSAICIAIISTKWAEEKT